MLCFYIYTDVSLCCIHHTFQATKKALFSFPFHVDCTSLETSRSPFIGNSRVGLSGGTLKSSGPMADICFTLQFVLLLYFFGHEFTTILQPKTKEKTYVGKSDFCHYFRPREVASLSLLSANEE